MFLGTQAFWLIPLLTYHGSAGLPIPQAPNFNVLTLGHGLTGVDAFWTGGTPAQLVQSPLNPAYKVEEFKFYMEDIGVRAVIVPLRPADRRRPAFGEAAARTD